jgi:hypothetical protein
VISILSIGSFHHSRVDGGWIALISLSPSR